MRSDEAMCGAQRSARVHSPATSRGGALLSDRSTLRTAPSHRRTLVPSHRTKVFNRKILKETNR